MSSRGSRITALFGALLVVSGSLVGCGCGEDEPGPVCAIADGDHECRTADDRIVSRLQEYEGAPLFVICRWECANWDEPDLVPLHGHQVSCEDSPVKVDWIETEDGWELFRVMCEW
jgi:hypothetical protein